MAGRSLFFQAMLCLAIMRAAIAVNPKNRESGPTLDFFNYSGMQATISCEDHPAKRLDAGTTFSIPLTRSDQACIVTLKDGERASATIAKLLPAAASDSGHSVSVDINDTFLFFSLDETPHHQYVNFLDNSQIEASNVKAEMMERDPEGLLLWSLENASDD